MAEMSFLHPQFAVMFKYHKQLSFKFKFEYNSETGLSTLNFSFVHSSKAVHKYLPVNSPQSLLQILCSVLTKLEREVILFRKCLLKLLENRKVGRWERDPTSILLGKGWAQPSGGKAPGSMQKLTVGTQSHRKLGLLGSVAHRSTCSNLLLAAMQGQLLI